MGTGAGGGGRAEVEVGVGLHAALVIVLVGLWSDRLAPGTYCGNLDGCVCATVPATAGDRRRSGGSWPVRGGAEEAAGVVGTADLLDPGLVAPSAAARRLASSPRPAKLMYTPPVA